MFAVALFSQAISGHGVGNTADTVTTHQIDEKSKYFL
ncbi:hypothetical protein BJ998_008037 [Kutzneria kofuensis]|uniref:Uncharacterized protein n=1 Tax=Kutzneria kofuensis TaxID=103725 RepID=A0A7W9KQW1_9PSEU|nr:hypothetical protein [Kutzneria kofuensis]